MSAPRRASAAGSEQAGSLARSAGRVQTEVRRRPAGVAIAAARRALEQAALQQERLVHVLDGLGRLADRDRERAEPDRAARERAAQRVEDRPVDLVEAELVDLEQRERVARGVGASTRPSARTSA